MQRVRPRSRGPLPPCPQCTGTLWLETGSLKSHTRCYRCGEIHKILRCSVNECDFIEKICMTCNPLDISISESSKEKNEFSKASKYSSQSSFIILALGLCIILLLSTVGINFIKPSELNKNSDIVTIVEKFKKSYPSQRNETWYHFLSVLEQKIPSVKSITFLYNKDKKTCDCLMNELVSLHSDNKNIKSDEITFSSSGFEGGDYGLALEHYRTIVRKFRVFIADLSLVPGSLARIFHTLCDDVSSDIKPSLFIFTLKYDKKKGNLKPLEKATSLLQETWSDLPENELFPLLSRVVKNVVEIVPESQLPC